MAVYFIFSQIRNFITQQPAIHLIKSIPIINKLTSFTMKIYLIIVILLVTIPKISSCQLPGDFQTKNATGNWSDFNAWNIYTGAVWIPAVGGQIPSATSNVLIQSNNAINVDITTAVCNDLNFGASGITLKVIVQANNKLSIYGNLNQFDNSNVPFPLFGVGAKIIFAGSSNQVITNSDASTNLNTVEINKSGGTFTLPATITKFDVFTLTAGTVSGASGSTLQGSSTFPIVNINGGIWNQTAGGANKINGGTGGATCALNINSGIMTLSTTSGVGYNFSSVTISNGGILNLNNDINAIDITTSFFIDATSTLNTAMGTTPSASVMTFLGTVNYIHSAAQNIINTSYANLGLSGGGKKIPIADLNITKNVSLSGAAILPLTSLIGVTIGGHWTNYGTAGLTESGSTINFNGSGAQSINTLGGEDFFVLKKTGSGTLTLNADVRIAGTSSELIITTGILDAGTFTLSGTASTAFVMSGGILRLAKLSTTVPELAITPYSLTGGTIELYGSGTQILRGGKDYRNLTFSGNTSTTLASNPKSIMGTVFINSSALLDIGNSDGFGDINTNLTMDGGRFKMSGSGTSKPDIDGTYTLISGIIEFAGSDIGTQPIKGSANNKTIPIVYKNIEVNGSNVGASSNNIILYETSGSFTVKNGKTFTIGARTIKSNNDVINTSTVTIEDNANWKSANDKGFSGYTEGFGSNSSIHSNIAAANISLGAGSTVDYTSIAAQVISNQIPYQNLSLSVSGIKTAPATTLTIKGNFAKSGMAIFSHNNGTVLLNGATQSFAGLIYNNLWLDNAGTKTLSANTTVIDSIKIGNTGTDPVTNLELNAYYLTLQSNAGKTARLATVAPNATITYSGIGRFIVQRNIPPQRAWRLMTAPVVVDATKTVFNAWQRGGVISTGTGIFISGPLAPAGGLDVTPLGNYSLKLFNGTELKGVPDTKVITISGTAITPGTPQNYGMFLFVRGDRSSSALFYPPYKNETTLSDTGMVQIKTQTFNLTGPAATGYALVGNPFASEVDMNAVMASGVNVDNTKYYMYDPFINTEQGGYLTYFKNISTGLFESVPESPGGQKSNVYSSQAFYVFRTGVGATLTFTENNKRMATPLSFFRPVFTTQSLRTNLYLQNTDNSSMILADGNIARFDDDYSNEAANASILKFTNIRENLGLLRNGKMYAVENRKPVMGTDTLFMHLLKTTQRSYQFQFLPENIDPLLTAMLEDGYTGIKIPISLSAASTFSFSITTDSASAISNRFRVVFTAPPVRTLSVMFTSIKASRQNNDIVVEWAVINEVNNSRYEIEKSADGQHFTRVNTTAASEIIMYDWLDKNAWHGDNFFRIKNIDNNGLESYSSIVKIKFDNGEGGIDIYSNPVTDGIISLQLLNQPKGVYQFRLLNNLGQSIFSKSFNHVGGNIVVPIIPGEGRMLTGTYHLQVVKPDKTIRYIKVVAREK